MPTTGLKLKDEIEFEPKGRDRFEAPVGAAMRHRPRHRKASPGFHERSPRRKAKSSPK
jgi:hypothetical protein